MEHKHVLRAIKKCIEELSIEPKFGLNKNIIENIYLGGAKGKERKNLRYDKTEFGLALLLLYINTSKARLNEFTHRDRLRHSRPASKIRNLI
jgi:phage regulator Rha-like protein